MSLDKQYPLSETKRKELRREGVVPYSAIATRSFLISFLSFSFLYLFNGTTLEGFKLLPSLDPLPFIELSNLLVYLSLATIIFIIIMQFFQTSFLLLSFRKHPKGIRNQERKKKAGRIFYRIIIGILTSSFIILFLYHLITDWSDGYKRITEHGDMTSIRELISSIPFEQFGYFISITFLTLGIISYITARINFLEHHRMSKNEIIEENK